MVNALSFLSVCLFVCHVACGISVLRPGIKPVPLALPVWSLNHWTTREVSPQAVHPDLRLTTIRPPGKPHSLCL